MWTIHLLALFSMEKLLYMVKEVSTWHDIQKTIADIIAPVS